jgi:hypothetical protein
MLDAQGSLVAPAIEVLGITTLPPDEAETDADSGPGVLCLSGLIAGGAATGVVLVGLAVRRHDDMFDRSKDDGCNVNDNPPAPTLIRRKEVIMRTLWMRCSARSALAATVLFAAPLVAQPPTSNLVGLVRDSAGHPIPGVEVWLNGSDLYTHTNDNGGFRIPNTPVGAVKVSMRRMGFEQTNVDLVLRAGQTDSLVVALNSVAAKLEGVLVEDEAMTRSKRLLAGFWDRRSHGFGHYFTRDEIEKRDPHDFTDIVRTTPSLSVVNINGRKSLRFTRSPGVRGDCPPQYWVDGMRLENATPDEFPPQDVEAIELYSGSATIPPQFAPRVQTTRTQTCGVIVIWTRLPGA